MWKNRGIGNPQALYIVHTQVCIHDTSMGGAGLRGRERHGTCAARMEIRRDEQRSIALEPDVGLCILEECAGEKFDALDLSTASTADDKATSG